MKEFVLEVPLRWGGMDAMAHLNNVMYLRLMEEARIQWFQRNPGAPGEMSLASE